jgi:hypothetical protein
MAVFGRLEMSILIVMRIEWALSANPFFETGMIYGLL